MEHCKRGSGKGTQDFLKKNWDTGGENKWQRGTSLFFHRVWPAAYCTICICLDCHLNCFQKCLHRTISSWIFLRLLGRCLVCKQVVNQGPSFVSTPFPSLRKSPWLAMLDWGHWHAESCCVDAVIRG